MFPIYLKNDDFHDPQDPIYYLVTKDGLFQVKQNAIFRSCTKVEGVNWLRSEEEGVRLTLPPLPASFLAEALAFFLEVFRQYKAEAIALIYYDEEKGRYELKIPRQKVAGGHCEYEIGPTPEGLLRIGTIHSHASAEAFHSELDDLDERHDDGLHLTIGNLDGDISLSCSLVVDGRRFPVKPEEIFEDLSSLKAQGWEGDFAPLSADPHPRDFEEGPSGV
ncbi:MAG: hypothetical protein HY347_00580 [candidate division NC10 bacterium]|nr:hypothetical protein [candidate division NC10 bacterium]